MPVIRADIPRDDAVVCPQPDGQHDAEESGRSVPQTGQAGGSGDTGGVRHEIPQTGVCVCVCVCEREREFVCV